MKTSAFRKLKGAWPWLTVLGLAGLALTAAWSPATAPEVRGGVAAPAPVNLSQVSSAPELLNAGKDLLLRGRDALAQGRDRGAEDCFRGALQAGAAQDNQEAALLQSQARINLGLLKVQQGDFDQAREQFRLVKENSPSWQERTYAIRWLLTISGYRHVLVPGKLGRSFYGGAGYPHGEGNLGDPSGCGGSGSGGWSADSRSRLGEKSPCGSPAWAVNMVNLNFYLVDVPLWYRPAYGPEVAIALSYNSLSDLARREPCGNKWQLNYNTYLLEEADGLVTVYMPDGRRDEYTPDGAGGYTPPRQIFNILTKVAEHHFELRFWNDTVMVYRIPPGTTASFPLLTEVRDARGFKLTLDYDTGARLTRITDALGKVTTFIYNSAGLIYQVTDPFGRKATLEYDGLRNLTKITDMGGYWTSLGYDYNIFMKTISNSRGTWTIETEPPDGGVAADTYPPPGGKMGENFRITVTSPLNEKQEFYYCSYDSYHQFAFTYPPRYGARVLPNDYVQYVDENTNNWRMANKIIYEYEYNNQFVSTKLKSRIVGIHLVTGEIEKIASFKYDEAGNLKELWNDYGGAYTYEYNARGRVAKITDPLKYRQPTGNATTLTYAPNDVDVTAITDLRGTVTLTYNAYHQVTGVTDRLGQTSILEYNGYGQLTKITDRLGIVTQYVYNDSGDHRLREIRRDGQRVQALHFDARGRVDSLTDASGVTVGLVNDDLDRLTRIDFPDGKFIQYKYATCCPHLLDSYTDRGGRTTIFLYDKVGRLSRKYLPDNSFEEYHYDLNGNLARLIDAESGETTFVYDAGNRLIRKTYANGDEVTFTYNGGKLDTSTNARGEVTQYDYLYQTNLIRHIIFPAYGTFNSLGISYEYDAFGRLTRVERGYSTGEYTRYGYDANSRVLNVTQKPSVSGQTYTTTYDYDALGRRTKMTQDKGQTVEYPVYDTLNRVRELKVDGNTYKLDYKGNGPLIDTITRPGGGITKYDYDAVARLSGITHKDALGGVISQVGYTYDAQDLRRTETWSLPGSLATPGAENTVYTYNNQLNQVDSTSGSSGSRTYAYDKDGNLVHGYTPGGYPFTASYDPLNRLLSLEYTGGGAVHKTEYQYHGFRLMKMLRYTDGVLSGESRYLYDGALPIQERNAANQAVNEFAWRTHALGGLGGLLDLKQGGAHYSYLSDAAGNVTGLLNFNDQVVAAHQYDPFGVALATSGSLSQPLRFSGKPYDAETGLYYFGYRFYNPFLGRWLSREPLGELYSPNLNLYNFAANSPLNYVDPDGQVAVQVFATAIGALTGAGFAAWADITTYGHVQTGSILRGAAFGAATGLVGSLGGGWIWGGAVGFGSNVATQAITGSGCINWGSAAWSAAVGAAGGLLPKPPIGSEGFATYGTGGVSAAVEEFCPVVGSAAWDYLIN